MSSYEPEIPVASAYEGKVRNDMPTDCRLGMQWSAETFGTAGYGRALINQQEQTTSRTTDLLQKDGNFETGEKSQVSFRHLQSRPYRKQM